MEPDEPNEKIVERLDQTAPGWSDLFLGILSNPIQTITLLDKTSDSHTLVALTTQAFNTVFLVGLVLGCVRITPSDYIISLFDWINAITNSMIAWVVFSFVMTTLSSTIKDARPIRWKKSLVLTGWCFAPLVFFAPILCFKNILGPLVLPFATIPTWWTLFLLCMSYKIGLGISARKLVVLTLVVPPLLFFVYIFWTGLSIVVFASEIMSAIAH